MDALHDLYKSTAGEHWVWQENITSYGIPWNFSTPDANPCVDRWQGITCTAAPYFIFTIELKSFNLSGEIPNSVGVFSQMTQFILSNNSLRGTIPSSIGNLSDLINFNWNTNKLTGCIPESIGNLTSLNYLRLYSNSLDCTIPASIVKLVHLVIININTNHLTGTIPNYIGDIPGITDLYLYANNLHGPIPDSVGNWPLLVNFEVHYNDLTGTIPYSVGGMRSTELFLVDHNYLSGPLPASIANMLELTQLRVTYNLLTGTLSPSFGQLAKLSLFQIFVNNFHGSMPSTIGNMIALTKIQFSDNLLSGSLPDTLGQLPVLNNLNVESNKITGSLPATLVNCSLLNYIGAFENRLNGTLPLEYGALTLLTYFDISSNSITGTIPAEFGDNLINGVLNMNSNLLTGTLPDSLGKLTLMNYLDFSDNMLTGSLPDSYSAMTVLEYLYVQSNKLTGSLPFAYGNMTALLEMKMNNNFLSGSLPTSLCHLRNVTNLFLNDNKFSGSLYNLISVKTQTRLSSLLIDNNRLTGTLPDELFHLPSLLTLSAGSNCFGGTIPASACSSTTLSTLSLDGMSVSPHCRGHRLLSALSEQRLQHSAIPLCLLQLRNMTALHLSATGLTGSLPDGLVVSSTLQDLALSHNALTGTIPEALQRRQWVKLDLSFNKLTGELDSEFAAPVVDNGTTTTLALANNRFSGVIPHAVAVVQNIKLLTSNLFSCRIDHSDLPAHDSDRNNYQCGSDSFNAPFYIWLGIAATLLALFYGVGSIENVRLALFSAPLRSLGVVDMPQLVHVINVMLLILKLSFVCVCFGLLVLVPVYAALSVSYGTYAYQYAYTVSAAFLSGALPLCVLFVVWVVLLTGLLCVAELLLNQLRQLGLSHIVVTASVHGKVLSRPMGSRAATRHPLERLAVYSAFVLVNFTAVVGVNIAYVYVALYERASVLVVMQVILSFFKLFWNKFCSGYLVLWIANYISNFDPAAVKQYKKEFVSIQLAIALVNMIFVPCFVVAVINPDCFYYIFVPAPAVVTAYTYTDCTEFLVAYNTCDEYSLESGSSSYSPYFQYSYQCSSSFITYYAPAFVFLCITGGFLAPILTTLCQYLYHRSEPGTHTHAVLERLLPRLLRPLPLTSLDRDLLKPLCTASSDIIALLTYLAIILTFGVVFPPLAVALLVTMLISIVSSNMRLQRFVSLAVQQGSLHSVHIIEAECHGLGNEETLRSSFWLLLTCSCWFYTLFLFDTLGDAVGFEKAYWVLIVMPLMPMCMYVAYRIISMGNRTIRDLTAEPAGTELPEMKASTVNVLHEGKV